MNDENMCFVTGEKLADSKVKKIFVRLHKEVFHKYKDYLDDEDIRKVVAIPANQRCVSESLYQYRKNKSVEEWLSPFIIRTFSLDEHKIEKKLKTIDEEIDAEAKKLVSNQK